ncbi:hypothetical protein GCM10009557_34340 [Virgisporangium ochraceum]|uniref:Ceramidase n=1 Tax=Virgisporangium ochraceum TaxID=65505 RepID=A0A8J4EH39_9ACTN|nr:hypothetical protein [Virgisporangium ochraceum]GIJ75430.1 hypothetical protein Voc01_103470 [Virgisporangium ochraceum]
MATLQISTGRADITPPIGSIMVGYGVDTPRLATGVHRPLQARCSVLWDDGFPNVIVTVDTLAFGHTLHQSIRDKVGALGVGTSDFVLCASHTHSGPALPEKLEPYIAYNATSAQRTRIAAVGTALADTVVQLVADTLNGDRTTCTLDYKVGTAGFAVNREAMGYLERDVPVLVARSAAGDPLAILFGYGCHPVAAGGQSMLDPDFPGAAAERIEASTDALAQFVLGPSGDQDPAGASGLPLVEALGAQLAGAVTTAAATPGRALAGPVLTGLSTVSLPLDITNTPANLAAVRSLYTIRQANAGLPGYYRRHATRMIQQIDARSFATTVPLPLQVWKLSGNPGLRIAFSGGEVVSGFGAYFRTLFGGSTRVWFATGGNETPCYIPSDEILNRTVSYAAGKDADYPGLAGGSMTVYAYLGHFRGKPTPASPDGVEQIYINALRAMLGTP